MSTHNSLSGSSIPSHYEYSTSPAKDGQKVASLSEMPLKLTESYSNSSTQQIYYDINNNAKSPPSKYSKTKPAITIKPKPMPIAISKPSNSFSANFDMNSKSTLKSDISLNINTSKKWILPPRPRPGRKPTNAQLEECSSESPSYSPNASSSTDAKTSRPCGKKKVKIEKRDASFKEGHQIDDGAVTEKNKMPIAPVSLAKPVDHAENNNLVNTKMDYLTKLKEQELIRNYIEVINNQIKELRFVQNGVITFDALNSDKDAKSLKANQSSSMSTKTNNQPKSLLSHNEQLEGINNMNDLNKFLAYLTKSSNIIHSATKKFTGDSITNGNLNGQIQNYLDIRSTYKTNRTQELKRIEKVRQDRRVATNNNGNGTTNQFIPALLKPLNQIDSQNEIAFNVVEEDEDFLNQGEFLDRLMIKDEADEDIIRSNEVLQDYDKMQKLASIRTNHVGRPRNFSACGFCTSDSCLCLDTDLELSQLKR